ncbi:MAG: TonB-dependent receptor [Cyclobacteriaceae bacterium]
MSKPVLYFASVLFLGWTNIFAQSSQTSLRKVLTQLEGQHGVTFSYADEMINRIVVTNLDSGAELDSQLHALSDETGLVFEASPASIFIVKNVPRSLCVKVIDQDDAVLQGAQIIINSQPTNFVADENGIIRFNTSLTFQDTIAIRHLGYQDFFTSIKNLTKEDCPEIQMSFKVTKLNEVVITNYLTNGINADLSDHSLKIQTQGLGLLPGETDGDILLALRSLPGITAPNGKAGNLHIRGSTTDQTLLLFDNIPIYHKGHYFGAISPYNPAVVQSVSVYRSGFDPSLGGRVGGVIKLESNKSISDSSMYRLGINSYYTALSAQIPIHKKFMLSGAIRTAYPNSFQSPKLDAINTMVYQPSNLSFAESDPNLDVTKQDYSFLDYNLGAVYNMKRGQLSFSFLGIDNSQENEITGLLMPRRISSEINLSNHGGNLEWKQFWSPRLSTKISLMKSAYHYKSVTTTEIPDSTTINGPIFRSEIDDFGFIFDLEYEVNQKSATILNFGYQANKHQLLNLITRPRGPVLREDVATVHSSFFNMKSQPVTGFLVSAGLRTNYYTKTEQFFLEPRIMSSYKLHKFFSVKSSAGLYNQFINQRIFFDFEDTRAENFPWELASSIFPVIKSGQFMVGGIWDKNNFIIDLEFHQKLIKNLSVRNPNEAPSMNPPPGGPPPMGQGPPLIQPQAIGELEVQGLDLLLRKHWPGMDAWINYSLTKTEMTFDELNQLPFKTYYDQPHVLNIGSTLTSKKWKFSFGWQLASGTPRYTNSTFFPEVVLTQEMNETSSEIPVETNDGRFTPQHQLDLAVVYDISPRSKKWIGSIGLSILNVYDRQNLIEENFYLFGQASRTPILDKRYGIGFAPNLMLNLQF